MVQTLGTEPLTTEASGKEPSHIQPSGIQAPISPLSGEQPIRTTSPVKAPSAPMPSFTSQGPGFTRITAPIRGATLNSPTKTTQVGERTKAREARIAEIVRQQRNGTWDGIPTGFHIAVDSHGHEYLVRKKTAVDEGAIESKDGQKPEEVAILLTLGSPKTRTSKSSSEDEGLGQDLHDFLNDEGSPAVNRGSASPLPSLRGEDANYYDSDNAVDYGTDDDTDLLAAFEENNQPLGIQSQDKQQNNQSLRIDEGQASQPVLTKQVVMDLVAKDAGTLPPGAGWERTKQGYCGLLSGYESPNGSTVNVSMDLAALIIMSAVSESTIKNSLRTQQAANDRLLKQAEEHRVLAHKQFTEGLARMQAEQEKTIIEAARIRDEYSQSAKMAHVSYDSLMKRVEDNKGPNVVNLQISCLLKRSKQYEKDLQELNEKHEEELQDKEDMCARCKRDLDRALKKTKLSRKKRENLRRVF
jgi:hypothetical protein